MTSMTRRTFDKYERLGAYHWAQADPASRAYEPATEARYAVALDHMVAGDRVIDVGCGDGYLIGLARSRAALTAGIDSDPRGVALARRLLVDAASPREAPGIVRAAAEQLPFAPASFDTAFFVDVIEHIEDPAPCLGQIATVLHPGGRLIVTTPQRMPGRWWDRAHHVREYSVRELEAALVPFFDSVDVRLFLSRRWWWIRRRLGKGFVRFWARRIRNPFLACGTDPGRFHHLIAICTGPGPARRGRFGHSGTQRH